MCVRQYVEDNWIVNDWEESDRGNDLFQNVANFGLDL